MTDPPPPLLLKKKSWWGGGAHRYSASYCFAPVTCAKQGPESVNIEVLYLNETPRTNVISLNAQFRLVESQDAFGILVLRMI